MQLADFIQKARDEGKWLYSSYQDLWFSPDQLTEENAKGRFRWGIVNWQLRDPAERLMEVERRFRAAQAELIRVRSQTP